MWNSCLHTIEEEHRHRFFFKHWHETCCSLFLFFLHFMIDNLIYTDKREVPEIDKTLLEFLEKHLSNEFPDILKGNRDELLVHQGKLEVVKSLKFLYDEQNRRDDSFP